MPSLGPILHCVQRCIFARTRAPRAAGCGSAGALMAASEATAPDDLADSGSFGTEPGQDRPRSTPFDNTSPGPPQEAASGPGDDPEAAVRSRGSLKEPRPPVGARVPRGESPDRNAGGGGARRRGGVSGRLQRRRSGYGCAGGARNSGAGPTQAERAGSGPPDAGEAVLVFEEAIGTPAAPGRTSHGGHGLLWVTNAAAH